MRPMPTALEEGPSCPEYDGCGKSELEPRRSLPSEQTDRSAEVAAHLDDEHGDRQRQPDPEAAGHVGEFGILALIQRDRLRLESHAADRA